MLRIKKYKTEYVVEKPIWKNWEKKIKLKRKDGFNMGYKQFVVFEKI